MAAIVCKGGPLETGSIRISDSVDRSTERYHTWLYVNDLNVLVSGPVNLDPTYVGSIFADPLVKARMTPNHTLATLKRGQPYTNMTFAFDFLLGPDSTVKSSTPGMSSLSTVTKLDNTICIGTYTGNGATDTLEFTLTNKSAPYTTCICKLTLTLAL